MAFKNMENVLWQRLVSFERGKMPAYVGIDASRFLRCLKQLQLHSSLQKKKQKDHIPSWNQCKLWQAKHKTQIQHYREFERQYQKSYKKNIDRTAEVKALK